MRIRAIFYALKFGILPYWLYEENKHYRCSYLQHLIINLKYALRWLSFQEDDSDWKFEIETNEKDTKWFKKGWPIHICRRIPYIHYYKIQH